MIKEQRADFTQIKLPTIYYHLERLESAGLVTAQTGQEGSRPEKKVYCISQEGSAQFAALLHQELELRYRPTFEADALFYFSDHISPQALLDGLARHIEQLRVSIDRIAAHRAETLAYMPEDMRPYADCIFEHHAAHYPAELAWAEKFIQTIKRGVQ